MFRSRSTLVRFVVVFSIAAFVGGSTGLHLDRDDLLCDLGAVHDPSAHRIGSGSPHPASQPSHCFLCHWQRSFGNALPSSDPCELTVEPSSTFVSLVAPCQSRLVATSLVPRAPPA